MTPSINRGMDIDKCVYILFLDADDVLLDALEILLEEWQFMYFKFFFEFENIAKNLLEEMP